MNNNDLRNNITPDDIKKIFGNSKNKKMFLDYKKLDFKSTISKDELDELIIENWNYDNDKKIIRKMFMENNKYLDDNRYYEIKDSLLNEWSENFIGDIEWPFSQGAFDEYVQRVHNKYDLNQFDNWDLNSKIDNEIAESAIKFRRIKVFNIIINDYIEKKIIESNDDIIPTSGNRKSVDYYINGIRYDQKISKSPTKEFIRDFGDEYKEFAKNNPNKVAEYLYKYQDEDRFGNENRLFVVFLDKSKINVDLISLSIYLNKIGADDPFSIKYTYNHKKTGNKEYETNAFVVLI